MNSMPILTVLILGLSVGSSVGEARELPVHVIDDLKQGIKSTLSLILPDGKVQALGVTDDQGWIKVSESCGQGCTLKAEPRSSLYYAKRSPCPLPDQNLVVTRKIYLENLKANAATLETSGETAKAALVYNEIAVRTADIDPALSRKAEEKVYDLFAKTTLRKEGVVGEKIFFTGTDLDQGRTVLTESGKRAVMAFQKSNDIYPSGTIDYRTLSTAAKSDVSTFLYMRIDLKTATAARKK